MARKKKNIDVADLFIMSYIKLFLSAVDLAHQFTIVHFQFAFRELIRSDEYTENIARLKLLIHFVCYLLPYQGFPRGYLGIHELSQFPVSFADVLNPGEPFHGVN